MGGEGRIVFVCLFVCLGAIYIGVLLTVPIETCDVEVGGNVVPLLSCIHLLITATICNSGVL